jgi:hypothetical protein
LGSLGDIPFARNQRLAGVLLGLADHNSAAEARQMCRNMQRLTWFSATRDIRVPAHFGQTQGERAEALTVLAGSRQMSG